MRLDQNRRLITAGILYDTVILFWTLFPKHQEYIAISSGIHTPCGNGDAEEFGEGDIPQVKITYVYYNVAIGGEGKELSSML